MEEMLVNGLVRYKNSGSDTFFTTKSNKAKKEMDRYGHNE